MQPKHKAINNAGAYLCSGIYKYLFKFIFTILRSFGTTATGLIPPSQHYLRRTHSSPEEELQLFDFCP